MNRTRHERIFEALIVEMVQAGVIEPALLEAVAREFDDEAAHLRGSTSGDEAEIIASMVRNMALGSQMPRASEARAAQRRRRMVEKTEWLARQGDGGNEPA